MQDMPTGDSRPIGNERKLVQIGFYIAVGTIVLLLYSLLEITDDSPNFNRIGTIAAFAVFALGFAILSISMGLVMYGISSNAEAPMVRVACILAGVYLFIEFNDHYNPLTMANTVLGGVF